MNIRFDLVFGVLLSIMSVQAYGQSALNRDAGMIEVRLRTGDTPVEGASGTPYLLEYFVPAKVDNFERQYLVRYNASQGVMEFKNENDLTLVMSNEEEHTVRFQDGSGYVYKTMDLYGKRAWLREHWSDDKGNAFYIHELVQFFPKQEASSSYDSDKPARYERQEDLFYYKNSDGVIIDLPRKKKKLIQLFEEKGAKQFLKKNKVDIRSSEGMLEFIQYFLVA